MSTTAEERLGEAMAIRKNFQLRVQRWTNIHTHGDYMENITKQALKVAPLFEEGLAVSRAALELAILIRCVKEVDCGEAMVTAVQLFVYACDDPEDMPERDIRTHHALVLAQLERIFENLYRAENPRDPAYGLATVNEALRRSIAQQQLERDSTTAPATRGIPEVEVTPATPSSNDGAAAVEDLETDDNTQ